MNQNRSMQAHDLLMKKGIAVRSFGTNSVIRLPGETIDAANVYEFGTTYKEIHEDLCRKNEEYYREAGILYLLERNMRVKEKPENFFEKREEFDLVITCEEKVFTGIYEHYAAKEVGSGRFVMVNFDIKDTPSDAVTGALEILEFVEEVIRLEEEGLEYAVRTALEKHFERKASMLLFSVVSL